MRRARVDAGAGHDRRPAAGRRLAVGMPSVAAARVALHDLALELERRAEQLGRARPRRRPRPAPGCGWRRPARPRARPAARPPSRTPGRARSDSASPRAPCPKRKFAPTLTCRRIERADQHLVAEVLRPSCESSSVNGITSSSSTPSSATSSALRVGGREQLRRVVGPQHLRADAGRRSPRSGAVLLTGAVDRGRDHAAGGRGARRRTCRARPSAPRGGGSSASDL